MGVTIRDVAHRAGVSTATVSRVLSGASASRPGTVAAVRAAAEALAYSPSGIARSLKTRSTGTLGLIVTDVHNPFFPELVRAVEDAAWEHGLRVMLCNGARDPRREADYLTLLQERRVDGLIVAAGRVTDEYAAHLEAAAVPVVIVNSERRDLRIPSIVSDNRAGGHLAAEHLLALGHTRFAILTGPAIQADAVNRIEGAIEVLVDAGIARADVPVLEGVGGGPTGTAALAALLAGSAAPTALVCFNDVTAIDVLRTVRGAGRRVPDEVSVIGFDDIDAAAWVYPPLTTIAQQKGEMGRWAVGCLVDRIAEQAAGDAGGQAADAVQGWAPERIVLPVTLRVRGSTGPAPIGAGTTGTIDVPVTDRGLVRHASAPSLADGRIVGVDPTSAGWKYLDIDAHRLAAGRGLRREADDRERLVLVLEGRAAVRAGDHDFGVVGSRASVFDGPPPPVILVAPGLPIEIVAETEVLVVVASAPAGPVRRTACVPPEEILVEHRGAGQTARKIHHLLPPAAEAGRLISFEVFTPGGNWSSYPPHKHDTEDPPREARLEEIYFYRFARPEGFAFQRVYTPDRSLDEIVAARDGDLVLVPAGYHPVAAAAGYDCYYLNIMAGPNRAWYFTVDPDHAWMMNWDPAAPRTAAHEEALG